MAVQLMKLRNVPADELEEIHALLAAHELPVYETSAGTFGISMPALWLSDDSRQEEARQLLERYADERQARVRAEYETLKSSGKARTWLDIAREAPLRFVLSLALVAALLWISLVPWLRLLA